MADALYVLFHPARGGATAPIQGGPYSEAAIERVGDSFELFLTFKGRRHREARMEGGRWVMFDPQGVPMGFCAGVAVSCVKKDFGRSAPSTGVFS